MQRLRAIALISFCGFVMPASGQDSQPKSEAIAKPFESTALPPVTAAPPAGIDPIPDASPPPETPLPTPERVAGPPVDEQSNPAQPVPPDDDAQPADNAQPAVPDDNAQPAAQDTKAQPVAANVWDHIRAGFRMPTIADPLVTKWENFYAGRPDYWQRINERSKRYLHFITKEIERRGMPLEIALLPVIESAFNPEALSRARAVGIWQFVPATGRFYGLEQNWWQDNRRDVGVATKSALDYLEKLHDMFGDWQLALASYNWGEGAVRRAIEKNRVRGKRTDWASLQIPNETRNYLPKLQAVKNIVLAPEKFGLSLPEIPDAPYFVTVTTPKQIDVALAAKLADMRLEDFKVLNPAHNRPVMAGRGDQRINLPQDKAELFVTNLDSYQKPLVSWRPYEVKRGEGLDKIAPQFGINIDELKRVNGLLGRKRVFTGYTLLVPAKAGSVDPIPTAAFKEAPPEGPGWHRVRRGETLARIADRYGINAADLKQLNGLAGPSVSPGRKLRLYEGVALGGAKSRSSKAWPKRRMLLAAHRR